MGHDWYIRSYREGDEAAIVRLINIEPRDSQYPLSRWMWRYKQNPYGFLAVVAELNGAVVGHLAMGLLELKVGDRTVIGSQAGDLIVHPECRRQGMFLALGRHLAKQAAQKNVAFTFIYPNNEAPYRGHRKYGYFDIRMIPTLVSYLDFRRAVSEKHGKIITVARAVSPLINYLHGRRRKRLRSSLCVTEVFTFNDEIDELWSKVAGEYNLIVARRRKYLNWRYFACKEWPYTVRVATEDGVLKGFLVTSLHKARERRIGYIIDFLCDSEDTFLQLVAAATHKFTEENADSIKCLHNRWSKVLQEYGFSTFYQPKLRMCGRVNVPAFKEIHTRYATDWFVNYGDCDFI